MQPRFKLYLDKGKIGSVWWMVETVEQARTLRERLDLWHYGPETPNSEKHWRLVELVEKDITEELYG
jgi:hypothetical protein